MAFAVTKSKFSNQTLRCVLSRNFFQALTTFSDFSHSLESIPFATIDVDYSNDTCKPGRVQNCLKGDWVDAAKTESIVNPFNGEKILSIPLTSVSELDPFIESLSSCPKHGLHNPLKNQDRYLLYGEISAKAANALSDKNIFRYFAKLIQIVSAKSFAQAMAEVSVTQKFLENFSGDQVRFLASSFSSPGNHFGQKCESFRWPYGPVSVISPFNFPLEIPVLQTMGALYMGNKPVVKVDSRVSVVFEQFVRLLHTCGMPKPDLDLIHCDGLTMNHLLKKSNPRMTQFTGSSKVAEKLIVDLKGKVKIEDAGFDWKILGPDVSNIDYVSYVCDQDAYACSGQKCSAQSIVFMHQAWVKAGVIEKLKFLAGKRNLKDCTIGPILTLTNERIESHIASLLQIEGAEVAFGGNRLTNHSIPRQYGSFEPTAVFVPLKQILKNKENFELVTTEIFGPFQILTEFSDDDLPLVLDACEKMKAHLTAAIVSNDQYFIQNVLSSTVNGTTYAGLRARTTGAPQNHWFGPCGDPRGAGIGTREAIQMVWSSHREIITDYGPIPSGWSLPSPT